MKLAIYGDSYGDPRTGELNEKAWVDCLRTTYDLDNYSFTGSGLFYSYDMFLKTHDRYENIIFLVTTENRLTLPHHTKLQVPTHISYIQSKVLATRTSGQQQNDYTLVTDYYEHIHNEHKDAILHQLMVENVKRLRPDAILYPCFQFSYLDDFPLYHVTKFEDEYIGMNDNKRVEFYHKGLRDSRSCHMTEKNNEVVAKMFHSRLNGMQYKLSTDVLTQPDNNIEYYYQSKFVEPYNYIKNLPSSFLV
jgi:hypothetical protein